MNTEQEAEAQEIALVAIGLDREECEAYLRQRPAAEPEVLAEVRRRLELASRIPDGFLDRPAVELQGGREDEAVDLPGGAGPAEPAAGTELPFAEGRRYRLGEVLGAGGMAVVFRAFDRRLERSVALKHLRAALVKDPRALERFEREARATARMSHPAVVEVFDVLRDRDDLWIVMELVPGEPLASRLARGPLELGEALLLAAEIAGGLAAAHALGIVHQDLKAANVMVTPEGRVKILDFGLAGVIPSGEEGLITGGGRYGTPSAMSPEQVSGSRIDARSDLFSFGALLYQMVTGSSPFAGSSTLITLERVCRFRPPPASQLDPRVPEELSELIQTLLEKDPGRRPADTAAVARTLARLAESTSAAAAAWSRRSGPLDASDAAFPSAAAERRLVTVLSCQLMAGDGSGRPLDAEQLLAAEGPFRDLALPILDRRGAHLAERLDGLTVYFGFPRAREDDAHRGVAAALDLAAAVERWNAGDGGPAAGISLRAGVDTGPVVCTTLPDDRRQVVTGRTGCCAAEIGMATRSGAVLVSAATHRVVRRRFRCEPLGDCPLPCCEQPSEIYRVVAPRPAGDDGAAVEPTPFLGRQAELELLHRCWQRTGEGRGRAALLSGEAGSGKTRLVGVFRALLDPGPGAWLEVSCRSAGSRASLGRRLSQALGSAGEAQPDLLLRRLADRRQGGAVLAIEDVHLAEACDLELLGQLIDQAPATRLLLLMTCRQPFDPPWQLPPGSNVLSLGGLAAGQDERMIRHLAAGRALGAAAEARILAAADGMPRFVEELTRALLSSEQPAEAVPASLSSWLTARLDGLGDAREVARAASVLGREFTREQLTALVPAAGDAVDQGLERLVEAEVLQRRGGRRRATYGFRLALLRDAAYESLIGEHRRLYRRRARDGSSSGSAAAAGPESSTLR